MFSFHMHKPKEEEKTAYANLHTFLAPTAWHPDHSASSDGNANIKRRNITNYCSFHVDGSIFPFYLSRAFSRHPGPGFQFKFISPHRHPPRLMTSYVQKKKVSLKSRPTPAQSSSTCHISGYWIIWNGIRTSWNLFTQTNPHRSHRPECLLGKNSAKLFPFCGQRGRNLDKTSSSCCLLAGSAAP